MLDTCKASFTLAEVDDMKSELLELGEAIREDDAFAHWDILRHIMLATCLALLGLYYSYAAGCWTEIDSTLAL